MPQLTASSMRLLFLGCAGLGLLGCGPGPLEVEGRASQSFSIAVGGELDVSLFNTLPYDSLPEVSSSAVRFLDMQFVGPNVPAGGTQRFRFKGAEQGRAVIVFSEVGGGSAVVDTVYVH